MLLLASFARAASIVAYEEDFDAYLDLYFSGAHGWESGFGSDDWSAILSGGVWARSDESSGTWGSGEAVDNHLVYTGLSFTDFTYQVKISSGDTDTVGVVFRYQDAENFYLVFFTLGDQYPSAPDGTVASPLSGGRLYRVSGGVATVLDTTSSTATAYRAQELRVECAGDEIVVYFDVDDDDTLESGELVLSATDSTLSEGQIGLYCFNNGGSPNTCVFDDVVVSLDDTDADTVPDTDDNCPDDANTDQADTDGDGVGDDCDADLDGDGHTALAYGGDDCNDEDDAVNPSVAEDCATTVDDDCSGSDNDDDALGCSTRYADFDADLYGDPSSGRCLCEDSGAWDSVDATDCDDADVDTHPGASETCDGVDDDCDGTADEDAVDAPSWYLDADSDGTGAGDATMSCAAPEGHADEPGDCDDGNAGVHPGAEEHCDSVDEDCDGEVDEDPVDATAWPVDGDGDGWGGPETTEACALPEGHVALDGDCDDADAAIHPEAEEHCDGVDEDCDGETDEDAVDAALWYADEDGDGAGAPLPFTEACSAPEGHIAEAGDCDDADATVYTGAPEAADGVDDDCDGLVDEGLDSDGDGLDDDVEREQTDTDPFDADSDDDGLDDGDEVLVYETDPLATDSDGGGVDDGTEVNTDGTDPTDAADDHFDGDGDGIFDGDEATLGTDPTDADSDDDGLTDGAEVGLGTDPTDADTDGDGLTDGAEVAGGSDPLDPTDPTAPDDTGTLEETGTVDTGSPAPRTGSLIGGTGCATVTLPAWGPLLAAMFFARRRARAPQKG